jgi:hypothetical protein
MRQKYKILTIRMGLVEIYEQELSEYRTRFSDNFNPGELIQ